MAIIADQLAPDTGFAAGVSGAITFGVQPSTNSTVLVGVAGKTTSANWNTVTITDNGGNTYIRDYLYRDGPTPCTNIIFRSRNYPLGLPGSGNLIVTMNSGSVNASYSFVARSYRGMQARLEGQGTASYQNVTGVAMGLEPETANSLFVSFLNISDNASSVSPSIASPFTLVSEWTNGTQEISAFAELIATDGLLKLANWSWAGGSYSTTMSLLIYPPVSNDPFIMRIQPNQAVKRAGYR